ncbi:GumC family protein [Alsobacter sp. SYSU BS001988]
MSIVTHHRWQAVPPQTVTDAERPRGWASEAVTIDLRGAGVVLRRRKWWLLVPLALCALGGLAGAMMVKPRYASTVQLLADPRELQVVRPDATLRVQTAELSASDAETTLGVLRSASILGKVVEQQGLNADPEFTGEKPSDNPALTALTALEKRVAVKRAERSFVVDVGVWSLDAAKAARIANAIATVYLQEEAAGKLEAAKRTSRALALRIDELSVRVQEAERKVAEYRSRNDLIGQSGSLIPEQQITEVSKQLVTARARTADARARFDQVQLLRKSPLSLGDLPDAVGSAVVAQLRSRLADASRVEAEQATRLGPRHPDALAAAAQLRDVRRILDQELARVARAAEADYDRSRSAEESLSRNLDRLKSLSNESGEAMVRMRELERQAEASRAIYATFLQRAKEISEQQGIDTSNSRVISPAVPSQTSSGLSRAVVLAGATMAGLLAGAGLALGRELTDSTLFTKAQFASASGLPVLGVIAPAKASPRRPKPELRALVFDDPASPLAAVAFRIMDLLRPRGSRQVAGQTIPQAAGQAARSVLFLSVEPTFQRTQLAFNLAAAAARDEGRILLVDAEPSGGFTDALVETPQHGLADVLARRCTLDRAVLVDEDTEIGILAAGGAGPAQGRPSMDQLQATLLSPARGFDRIIIDAGGPAFNSSAAPLASAVDDVVLIVTAGVTRRETLQDTLELLDGSRSRIRGLIVA